MRDKEWGRRKGGEVSEYCCHGIITILTSRKQPYSRRKEYWCLLLNGPVELERQSGHKGYTEDRLLIHYAMANLTSEDSNVKAA